MVPAIFLFVFLFFCFRFLFSPSSLRRTRANECCDNAIVIIITNRRLIIVDHSIVIVNLLLLRLREIIERIIYYILYVIISPVLPQDPLTNFLRFRKSPLDPPLPSAHIHLTLNPRSPVEFSTLGGPAMTSTSHFDWSFKVFDVCTCTFLTNSFIRGA